MMMLKKPMAPFAKMASFKNKTLFGIHHLKFLVEKKRIFTPKKTLDAIDLQMCNTACSSVETAMR
jgi:hypothetical protein